MTSGLQWMGLGQATKVHVNGARKKRNETLAFTSCVHTCRNSEGMLTCSITSMEHTTSYCFPSVNNASAVVCRYFKDFSDRANWGSPAAWVEAIPMFASEASIPVVLAPSLARLWRKVQHFLKKRGSGTIPRTTTLHHIRRRGYRVPPTESYRKKQNKTLPPTGPPAASV